MAVKEKNAMGRVTLADNEIITGVVLEKTIQDGIKIRPTNTTATINIVPDTGTVDDAERAGDKVILLHNGPKGGFTQSGFSLDGTTADPEDYLVSDNVKAILTQ